MKALLLAAGYGTRLKPLTNTIPKCLVPINGKPLLEIWLDTLSEAGVTDFLINSHYLHIQVEEFINNSKYKENVTLAYEEVLLGTGSTLLKNEQFFNKNEPLMVIHADNLSVCDYKDFISSHFLRDKKTHLSMMLFFATNPKECGVVKLDKYKIVQEFHEKVIAPPSNLANGAVYIFEYSIFQTLVNLNKQNIDISIDIIPLFLGKINSYLNNKLHIDIGTIQNYKLANKRYKKLSQSSPLTYLFGYFMDVHRTKLFKEKKDEIKRRITIQKKDLFKNKRILAVYDCIDLPISNDIITFIIAAELERKNLSLEKIDIIFVSHASDPSTARHSYINSKNIKQFIYNMAIEQVRVFENIGSIHIFDNRNEFLDFFKKSATNYQVFPKDYNISLPLESLRLRTSVHSWESIESLIKKDPSLLCITPPFDQINLVRKWIKKNVHPKIPIVITLREWEDWASERDSKIQEWQKLVNYYSHNDRFIFIIIRDYNKLYDQEDPLIGKNIIYCNEASLSNSFRAALYQEATLNLFVSNGSVMYAVANKNVNYIFFSICSEGRGATKEALRDNLKLYYGDSFQSSSKYQKVVWERDYFEILKKETDLMLKSINNDIGLEPLFYNNDEDTIISIRTNTYSKKNTISKLQTNKINNRISIKYYSFFYYIFLIYHNSAKLQKNIFNYFNNKLKYNSFMNKVSINIKLLKLQYKNQKKSKKIKNKYGIYTLDQVIFEIKNLNKVVLIYGSGTIGEALYPVLQDNILFYIDINEKPIANDSKIRCDIKNLNCLFDKNLNFDYIIITPKYREKEITSNLVENFNIKKEKIIIF